MADGIVADGIVTNGIVTNGIVTNGIVREKLEKHPKMTVSNQISRHATQHLEKFNKPKAVNISHITNKYLDNYYSDEFLQNYFKL